MNPDDVPVDIIRLGALLPKFDDGRIDYTHATEAAVLDCMVVYNGKMLLLKRGDKVGWMKNRWHTIAGFLDEEKSLRAKALDELYEETGINEGVVRSVRCAAPFRNTDAHKTWIVHPVLIELSYEPSITLDWENTDHAWVDPKDVKSYGVIESVEKVIALFSSS
jgi:ADP-ribose pyrophosphatase YjhB (NUDIX family)